MGGADDEVIGDDGGCIVAAPLATAMQAAPRSSTDVRLLRQFLAASLAPGDFVSMPLRTVSGELAAFIFEVLEKEARNKLVTTYRQAGELPELFCLSAQPFERCAPATSKPDELGQDRVLRVL